MTAPDSIELIQAPKLTDRAPYAYAAVASDVRRSVFTAGTCLAGQAEKPVPTSVRQG
ncbi:hypothetical protein [Virgisporangium aurantiacum]|uniref:Uncharacterized protein n=1 Tax=Virgisporangium aurantiacum TaxID=175570 RepID=A0A8J4E5P4_9ACTN|nr:hypothetical protein [Virgisporangium aurantiacum]GIJ62334.1 hypothetical protein Vau01_098500 [Virgisporangium aurantiacum]